MKKAILGLLVVCSSFCFAQTNALTWYGWNEGYELALKENKIILVDAYTDWCGWCKKMDKDTYSNPDVIKKINANFVAIKFNPEVSFANYKIGNQTLTNQELYNQLSQGQSTGFPTTYYITPNKNNLMVDAGYKGPSDFLKILDVAIENAKK